LHKTGKPGKKSNCNSRLAQKRKKGNSNLKLAKSKKTDIHIPPKKASTYFGSQNSFFTDMLLKRE
jgi:hypothetical protein